MMDPGGISMRLKPAALAALTLCASAQAPRVDERALRAHLAFLSDDLLEGRGTGQRGFDLAARYVVAEASRMGLQPGNGASYLQPVRIAGVETDRSATHLAITGAKEPIELKYGPEWVVATGTTKASIAFDAPLLFVGYGVIAPEERWNDYKGADGKDIDCRGRLLVMMVNDPQPTAAEPGRFGGAAMTYYGRWTYKYEEALRRGAAGVLLIHTDASARYGWQVVESSNGRERFHLASSGEGNGLQGWMTEASARRVFTAAGQDLDALRARAETRDFHPVALNLKLQGTLASKVRVVDQSNVAAVVPGADPKLKDEVVIYSAHLDHLGKDEALIAAGKDGIYNGAVDNASGSAALLAMAEAAVKAPARRSQMFLWVCAEEQGLLGSEAYAQHPLWPLDRTAAALNLDSLNWVGPTRDIALPGSGRTSLGALAAEVAAQDGLKVAAEAPDLGGGYFRSDHFNFAKAGVPAFSIEAGHDFLGLDAAAKRARAASYEARYHQPSDEYDPAWDLGGMAQQAQFTLDLGRAVAEAPAMPVWDAADPFGAARRKEK
jgi:Zn-dependent M28 family amino/carboxypeptidase